MTPSKYISSYFLQQSSSSDMYQRPLWEWHGGAGHNPGKSERTLAN